MESLTKIKEEYKLLLQSYLCNYDTTEIEEYFIEKTDHVPIGHIFIWKAIELGLDWEANDWEALSMLFVCLSENLGFTGTDFALAFDFMLFNYSNYAPDCPDMTKILGNFIARSTYDYCLNGCQYLLKNEAYSDEANEVLDVAVSSLLLVPMDYHMKSIWGATLNNEDFITKVKTLVSDWLNETTDDPLIEAVRTIKTRRHEIVWWMIISVIQEDNTTSVDSQTNQQRMVQTTQQMKNQGILTSETILRGVKWASAYMEDL